MSPWQRMRELWPSYTLLPVAPFGGWALFCLTRGAMRWDHLLLVAAMAGLAYGNRWSRQLYLNILPLALTALLYDGMRFIKNLGLGPDNVHICDLRQVELAWFGVPGSGSTATLQDYFFLHHSVALDLLCAIPYGTFLLITAGYAVYLFVEDRVAAHRFVWGFLILNAAGFLTYHLYPAAPPWYFHSHGCAVDLGAAPSAGPSLLRVDALLGTTYFQAFYARASDVFGAVPSLHVAYPILILSEGWSRHRLLGKSLLVLFYISMCFSAVYLDHHWVVDLAAGSLYAVAVAAFMRVALPSLRALPARLAPATGAAE